MATTGVPPEHVRIAVVGTASAQLSEQLRAEGLLPVCPISSVYRANFVLPECDVLVLCCNRSLRCVRALRRESSHTAVLLISPPGEGCGAVDGLRTGADDCVEHTASVAEIVARIRCLNRRVNGPSCTATEAGGIILVRRTFTVTRAGAPVRLTPHGFALLEVLLSSAGEVVTYERLVERCWSGADGADGRRRLSVAVCRLRSALGSPCMIEHVSSVGYRLKV